MPEAITPLEPTIRIGFFIGSFALFALWELWAPRRIQAVPRLARWPGNLAITLLNTAMVRVLLPTGAVGVAVVAQAHGWGLFNQVTMPEWFSGLVAVILLDLVIYLQHLLFHAVPALWRLHRMHHADQEFDFTTGSRFHPIEIALSMLVKIAVVIALGVPPIAVLIFEILLSATATFNHANIRMPIACDRVIRWFVVTPDMHRVHHSTVISETNSNFGFNLPWWDRLFVTYQDQPKAGHEGLTIGLPDFRALGELRIDRMLTQPFRD